MVDDGGVTSPALDQFEAGDVAPPRVDPFFNLALVKILNVNADPYGPDMFRVASTNGYTGVPTNPVPIIVTNFLIGMPTNPVVSFQKCNLRVPEDVTDSNNPNGYTKVTFYAARSQFATNTLGDYFALPHQ